MNLQAKKAEVLARARGKTTELVNLAKAGLSAYELDLQIAINKLESMMRNTKNNETTKVQKRKGAAYHDIIRKKQAIIEYMAAKKAGGDAARYDAMIAATKEEIERIKSSLR